MLMDRHNILFEVSGVPEAVTLVKFPTWSAAGDQDDIQWVELSKDSDGVWRAWKQMPEDGEYYIHAYYNTASQENKVSFTTSYTPEAPVMNAVNNRIMGKVSVVKSDEETGKKLRGAVYNITAKNDILSPQGTVINKAGDLLNVLSVAPSPFIYSVLLSQIKWIHGTEIQISKSDNFGENVANAGFELKQWNKKIQIHLNGLLL